MKGLGLCAALSVAGTIVLAGGGKPPAVSLRTVLDRASHYAVSYGASLASIVADEDFRQELVLRDGTILQRRRLESEIAFVTLDDTTEWLAFRGAVRVDGEPVPGAAGRLERLFRETPRSALAQAAAIAAASALYNLGPVQRNFNVPTTVLQFILPQHRNRFRFRKAGEDRVEGEPQPLWMVEFREQQRGTFIRTPEGRSAPAAGRLWIDPQSGRIVRSRLIVDGDVRAEIDVVWRRDSRLDLWVPADMHEGYRGPWTAATGRSAKPESYEVRGAARYSNYRRFEVDSRMVR